MLLEAHNLSKSYQENQEPILRDLSLEIESDQFIAIMGPSGCGKSTLLNLLSTIDRPDQGQILYQEQDLLAMKDKDLDRLRRESFGFVFQQATFLKNLNILDNICLPSIIGKKSSERKASHERAKELMALTGIKDIAHRSIHQVSGGQLQRAGICRALINQPRLIFADEPTGALDTKTGEQIMELLTELNAEGKTIIMVTHEPEIAAYAKRQIVIRDGVISSDSAEKEERD